MAESMDFIPKRPNEEAILDSLLVQNKQRLLQNKGLMEAIERNLEERHSFLAHRLTGDFIVGVSQRVYNTPQNDGNWEDGVLLYVDLTVPDGKISLASTNVPVGRLVSEDGESRLIPKYGFTFDQAAEVADMVQDIELAKMSGQIPNLSNNLTRISTSIAQKV